MMVSVLPYGIDVRKLQRSHSEISRVEPLSDLPSCLCFGLPIRFSVYRQSLSDLTLDRSNVDKLLCVNTALVLIQTKNTIAGSWPKTMISRIYVIVHTNLHFTSLHFKPIVMAF